MQELIDLFSCRCNHFDKKGRGLEKRMELALNLKLKKMFGLKRPPLRSED